MFVKKKNPKLPPTRDLEQIETITVATQDFLLEKTKNSLSSLPIIPSVSSKVNVPLFSCVNSSLFEPEGSTDLGDYFVQSLSSFLPQQYGKSLDNTFLLMDQSAMMFPI